MAMLATQGHWQAAQPVVVNVDYDVPAFGVSDEIEAQLRLTIRFYFLGDVLLFLSVF